MENIYVFTTLDETVDQVLKHMASNGVKEMAVLDDEGRILADISTTDLLLYYFLEKRNLHHSDNEQ